MGTALSAGVLLFSAFRCSDPQVLHSRVDSVEHIQHGSEPFPIELCLVDNTLCCKI
jgi:hypothetical protein